jgi:sporulation protein YlmC with PRC-barrel domain
MGTAKKPSGKGDLIVSVSALKGDSVVDLEGVKLGTLEEIMIDMTTGRMSYAVLAGKGDRLYAIPWETFSLDTENKRLVSNIERSDFEKATGFDRNNWPDMSDRDWGSRIHHLYRCIPHWERVEERWISGP